MPDADDAIGSGRSGADAPGLILKFQLDDHQYGLPLSIVERVLPAVEITPLPGAPAIVLGVFDLQGQVIPVVDIRQRFALPNRALSTQDHFIVARASNHRTVALIADAAVGVVEHRPSEIVESETVLPSLPHLRGVLRTPDGLILIHDLSTFLALDEARALDAALRAQGTTRS